jgi:hypothetical protein
MRRSIPVLQAAGDDIGLGQAHHYLAGIALLRARWADMLAESQAALEFRRRAADPTDVAQDEVGMAPLADRTPWVDLAPARATLGPEAEAVWEEGYALPLEAAVEEALRWLREPGPTGGRPAPPPPASA